MGLLVGTLVGLNVGFVVGFRVGLFVGLNVGINVGEYVGMDISSNNGGMSSCVEGSVLSFDSVESYVNNDIRYEYMFTIQCIISMIY